MNLIAIAASFGAGVISITSPCCLPLLPGYLGYLSGAGPQGQTGRRRVLLTASLFVTGFTMVFVALGATASELGSLLLSNRPLLERIAGGFILLMGIVFLLGGRVGFLARAGDWTAAFAGGRIWAALPLGAAFAITWTPCIGPILGAVLTLASSTADLAQGVILLLAYSLGLGIPFLALALSVNRVRSWLRPVGRVNAVLQPVSGAVLAAMGVLLLTGLWLPLMSPLLSLYARAHWPPI